MSATGTIDITPTTEAAEDPIGDANAEAESVARAFGWSDRAQDTERDR